MKKGPSRRDSEAVSPRPAVKVPSAVVNDLIGALRGQFLAECPEKRFFAHERPLLVRAVTYPAWFLDNRSKGAMLPWPRYQEIVFEVITTIKHHGATDRIGSFGRYFLTAIQRHMEHHWEDYYVESKNAAGKWAAQVAALQVGADSPERDATVPTLAALHAATVPKGGRKKKVAAGIQEELF